ncbi:MAG: hypothetical protein ACI7YS_04325 [Flavobacterium sp.]
MKDEYNELLEKINSNRIKVHFNLTELEKITGLCPRSLKYRMKVIKEKYNGVPSLLSKKGREWMIHYTILDDFMPKRHRSQTNFYNHPWETVVTWNFKNNYEVKYHTELIGKIKEILPTSNIAYVVEQDQRGFNHLHAIVDEGKNNVEQAVDEVLHRYLENTDFKCQVAKINNKSSITTYLQKGGTATII